MKTILDSKILITDIPATIRPPQRSWNPTRVSVGVNPHEPRKVLIKVILRSAEDAEQYCDRARKFWQKNRKSFIAYIDRLAKKDTPKRNLSGFLQPRVPRSVLKRFSEIAQEQGYRGSTSYMRDYLSRWISSETGERRKLADGRLSHPPDHKAFEARGRILVRSAGRKIDGEKLVRFKFDAKKLKPGIIKLKRKRGLNLSQFFSAIMERACDKWQRKQAKLGTTPIKADN